MVAPEREIPGIIAIACEIPITKAFLKDTFLSVFLALSARNKSIAVTISMQPTKRIFPPKSCSNSSSKNNPTNNSWKHRNYNFSNEFCVVIPFKRQKTFYNVRVYLF